MAALVHALCALGRHGFVLRFLLAAVVPLLLSADGQHHLFGELARLRHLVVDELRYLLHFLLALHALRAQLAHRESLALLGLFGFLRHAFAQLHHHRDGVGGLLHAVHLTCHHQFLPCDAGLTAHEFVGGQAGVGQQSGHQRVRRLAIAAVEDALMAVDLAVGALFQAVYRQAAVGYRVGAHGVDAAHDALRRVGPAHHIELSCHLFVGQFLGEGFDALNLRLRIRHVHALPVETQVAVDVHLHRQPLHLQSRLS